MKNKIIVITQISLMVITTTIAILIINDLNNQIELSQKAERRAVNEYDILLNQYKITENLKQGTGKRDLVKRLLLVTAKNTNRMVSMG